MIAPYYADDTVTLYQGDAAAVLAELDAGSVDCIVTSPPYFGLRDYGVDGQLGAEATPAAYVDALVAVFREARRVLADDGTLWLNIGDSYASTSSNNGGYSARSTLAGFSSPNTKGRRANDAGRAQRIEPGVPGKNLLGVPWRLAFALQADGWIVRNDVIWTKPNAMPESVRDRLSNRHEHVFMLTKSRRYAFDLDAVREPHVRPWGPGNNGGHKVKAARVGRINSLDASEPHPNGRNPGDVWEIPTQPFGGAHFATMPESLAARCILAACRPGGTVLDPFSGSGTTGLAATRNGRRYVGVDLSSEYLDLSLRTRLAQGALDLGSLVAPQPDADHAEVTA